MKSNDAIIKEIYTYYIFLFIAFAILKSDLMPPIHNAFLEVFMWVLGFLVSLKTVNSAKKNIVIGVFIFQCLSVIVMSLINIKYYDEVLGGNAVDALLYRDFGESYGHLDLLQFLISLLALDTGFDDLGFPTIIWLAYHYFSSYGYYILLVINIIVITFGSNLLYKFSYFFVPEQYCKLIAVLWGTMPFAITTATGGLKENIFAYLVLCTFYCFHVYYKKRHLVYFIIGIIFSIFLFFFRLSLGFAALLCAIIYLCISTGFVRNNIKAIIKTSLLISVLVFPAVMSFMATQRGVSDSRFITSVDQMEEADSGIFGFLINALSAVIGPFPNYIASDEIKANYITVYSFSPFLKMIMSLYFLKAIWITYKYNVYDNLSIIIYVLTNILMLIVAFFGLNMRLHWPVMPLYFITSIWGYYITCKINKSYSSSKFYFAFMLILIVIYNLR